MQKRKGRWARLPRPGPHVLPTCSKKAVSWLRSLRGRASRALGSREGKTYACLGAFVLLAVAALLARAWMIGTLFDDRELDLDLKDYGWQLEYVWRAGQGQWVGRDFMHVRGPLWQLLAWAGAGFRFASAGRAYGGIVAIFSILGLMVVVWTTLRSLSRPGTRLAATVLMTLLVLWLPRVALRTFIPLWVIQAYALARPGREPSEPRPRRSDGWWAALITTAALLLSYERSVMALCGVLAMAAYALLLRAGESRRAELVRLVTFVGAFAGLQVLVGLLAASAGASYLGYLGEALRIGRSYTLTLQQDFGIDPVQSAPIHGLALCALFLSGLFALRRFRDIPSGMMLLGALPTVVTALVRSDLPHVFMGIAVLGGALVLVSMRQLEQGRLSTFIPTAVLLAVMLLGWHGAHRTPLVRAFVWEPAAELAAARGTRSADPTYQGDISRAVAFARRRLARRSLRCIGTSEAMTSVHPLVGVGGSMGLRWSEAMQRARAAAIRRERCPLFIYDLVTFDQREGYGSGAAGEDLITLASLYHPTARLGPAVLALEPRPRERRARVFPTKVTGIDRWRRIPIEGVLHLTFDPPIEDTALLRIDYTLEIPEPARLLGGVPWMIWTSIPADDGPDTRQLVMPHGVNRRARHVFAVEPWTAQWRWIAGRAPRETRLVRGLDIYLRSSGFWTPSTVRMKVHSVQVLLPGAPARSGPLWRRAGPASAWKGVAPRWARGVNGDLWRGSGGDDLLARLRDGDADLRFASPRFEHGGLVLVTDRRHRARPPSVYYDLRPTRGMTLEGSASRLTPASGRPALQVLVIDPAARPGQRRVELARVELSGAPGEPARFSLLLDRWAGRDVMLKVTALVGEHAYRDRVRIDSLRLERSTPELTLAGALRAGLATTEGPAPIIEGAGDVFLHPNGPGEPVRQVTWPVEPTGDTCLWTGLRHRGAPGRGDGVWFEASVLDAARPTLLFRERLEPSEERAPRAFSLAPWAGRRVTLLLATRPGRSSDFDWAWLLSPHLAKGCPP